MWENRVPFRAIHSRVNAHATYSVKSHGPNWGRGLTKYDFTVTLVGRGKAGL